MKASGMAKFFRPFGWVLEKEVGLQSIGKILVLRVKIGF
jgi:hypothetical protein